MAVIKIYNTLSGTKETFVPLVPGSVTMYQCGPTVYDTVHIGNLRTLVMNDIIRRTFEYNNFRITQVMNITDVDDKTIRRSREEGKTLTELTHFYEKLFLTDIDALNILRPHQLLRASEYINSMIEMTGTLLEKGVAYSTADGIYFSIGVTKNYGELARLDTRTILKERIANDEYEKENPRDFALWKFYSPEDGDVSWETPFGKGRPGWHIECSAMATHALGPTIDIHTGGSDLIFPHHTNEIAQSQAAYDKKFVNYWIHGAMLNMNDGKMSKSKGNITKMVDLQANNISPLAFRYWTFGAHYRTQLNFTLEALEASQNALINLFEHYLEWKDTAIGTGTPSERYSTKFLEAVNDDFDMPKAIATVWEMVKEPKLTPADKVATILAFDKVLGFNLATLSSTPKSAIPPEVTVLAEAREEARKAKEWKKADALREEIKLRGFEVKDTETGFELIEI